MRVQTTEVDARRDVNYEERKRQTDVDSAAKTALEWLDDIIRAVSTVDAVAECGRCRHQIEVSEVASDEGNFQRLLFAVFCITSAPPRTSAFIVRSKANLSLDDGLLPPTALPPPTLTTAPVSRTSTILSWNLLAAISSGVMPKHPTQWFATTTGVRQRRRCPLLYRANTDEEVALSRDGRVVI